MNRRYLKKRSPQMKHLSRMNHLKPKSRQRVNCQQQRQKKLPGAGSTMHSNSIKTATVWQ
jgi:hypothetical protein